MGAEWRGGMGGALAGAGCARAADLSREIHEATLKVVRNVACLYVCNRHGK